MKKTYTKYRVVYNERVMYFTDLVRAIRFKGYIVNADILKLEGLTDGVWEEIE